MYSPEDDLNNDGIIDSIEHSIKVLRLKDQIVLDIDQHIKNEYLMKFRREVDFHHKAFYRFEKAYRLGKKQPHKKE